MELSSSNHIINPLFNTDGIEAFDDLKKKIKLNREDMLDLLRQDRTYLQDCVKKAISDLEDKFMHTVEGIRQNMFDIFNEADAPKRLMKNQHRTKE